MRYYWTDERYQITYGKRVTRAVKMVDSCSRDNGGLCTVARSWLLFLHNESEWKILNQILLEVLMNCTKHFDLSSSLTASCVARFVICWVCWLYFPGLVCSVLSLDECLIKINYGWFVYVFFMPGKSDLVGSFVFGQGRIQIPSLACLFDFVIWNEWFTEVS